MMHDEALHRAVLAAPDDDAPRLVYADWLTQHGDPRGEFIALDVALAKLPNDAALAARRHEVWMQHGGEWIAPFVRDHHSVPAFRRGFVEELHDGHETPLNLDADAQRVACLRRLVLTNPASLSALFRSLGPTRLHELSLEMDLEPDALAALLEAVRVESLIVYRAHAGHARAIVAVNPADLRSLALASRGDWERAGPDVFAALVGWQCALDTLHLQYCEIGAGALTAEILGAPPFTALSALQLQGAGLDERDVAAICASPLPLVELELSFNALGPAAARAIASTPRFAKLAKLGLANTKIGKDGLDALIASPHLPTTCQLGLDGEILDLSPDVWVDGNCVTGASWTTTPTGKIIERFSVRVCGTPTWETCQKYL